MHHLDRLDKKITKLENDIRDLKEVKHDIHDLKTTVSYYSKYGVAAADNRSVQTFRSRRSVSDVLTVEKHQITDLRPSRLILDQLSSINEAKVYSHPRMTLSDYHTNFVVMEKSQLPYNGVFLDGHEADLKSDFSALPFILSDVAILLSDFSSTVITINGTSWAEDVHAYLITSDLMIQQIRSLHVSNLDDENSIYDLQVVYEPITTSLSEFLEIASEKGVPILNVQCNTTSIKKDRDCRTQLLLLVRTLLFSKAKDYLLDNQVELTREGQLVELTKHFTRLEQSTMMINGVRLSKQPYSLHLVDMAFANNDVGDDQFALSLRNFFPKEGTYLSGNKLDANKVTHVISQQYLNHSVPVEVDIIGPLDQKKRTMQGFGIIATEVEMSEARNIFFLTEPKAPEGQNTYQDVLVSLESSEPKYGHPFHLIDLVTEDEKRIELFANQFKRRDKTDYFEYSLPEKVKITDAIVSGGFYRCPPKSIERFIDLFFAYPQMLPYSSELSQKYRVGMSVQVSIRSDGLAFKSDAGNVQEEVIHTGVLTMVQLNVGEGMTISTLKLRIPLGANEEQVLATRKHRYYNKYPKEIQVIDGETLDKFLRMTTLTNYGWDFHLYTGERWDREVQIDASFRGLEVSLIPILTVPDGFITWTQQYDLEFKEAVSVISALIYRSSVHEVEISQIKQALSDVARVVEHLVSAVNALGDAFNRLTKQLQKSSHVPWWKKVLQGIVMAAGLIGTIVFPFCLPVAIAFIAGSTVIQVGLMFADGDYIAGGVQLAGAVIGLGIGYYQARTTNASAYPVVNLEEARVLPPNELIPGIQERVSDGLWIEVKPLNILNNKMEDVGKFMIKNTKGLLRTLMKFDNAPVHARVRSQTTRVINGATVRTTIVTGVTDGMPYLSHVNPRPGTFELLEVYQNGEFVNGWTKRNVPVGSRFEDLGKSYQGLLIEGVSTDAEFQTLMNSWSHMDADERAIALNDAQTYIKKTQTMYTELPASRVPISFDETLIRNVSNVFAKHTGIYELIGLNAPSGPNNCQTYSKELRDFFAKGSLRKNKLNNTVFLNDLMDAFDSSIQFKHIYTPAFEKVPPINRAVVPNPLLSA